MTSYERRYAASVCCANQDPPRTHGHNRRLKPAAERGGSPGAELSDHCARPQKRGKRAGVRTRLTSKPARAALPSILLSNVSTLENKLDCIRLQRTTRRESRDCCVFVVTETWLSDRVPDAAIQLDGLASFRADRDSALCGKTCGGGLCVYINTEWCKNSVLVSSYCSPLVEFMIVRCRPFYLPREFTTVLTISVYIPPGANAKDALCELYSAISGLQNTNPDGLFVVAGDFNHVNLNIQTTRQTIKAGPKAGRLQPTAPPQTWRNTQPEVVDDYRGACFEERDKATLRKARAKLSRAIREAKRAHGQSIHSHIKTLLPPSLDPLQFAYHPNRSTDDAISTTLHLALTHLDNRDTYVRMLFIDFSSAFNTIIPQHLIGKLNLLGLNTSLSNWILDFLTGRPQSVRIGRNTSSTTTLSTRAPQGCVLSPLLFTLLTHDCAAMHSSNHIIKFADDTTVVGLISKNDESAYQEEVQRLTDWCRTNNLSLNVDKTKEMVVDFRRTRRDHSPIHIDGSTVEIVKSTKFLGVHLAEDLTWSLNTSTITKKAQQRLYFLRRLRKAHLPPPILTTFYRGTIESILSSCITAWFGNCTALDRKSLQRVVRTAEKIIGVSLPTITDIYTTRCIRKANSIVDDHTHPSHTLFTLLPSG
ncbi:hypothetical protein NFI96_026138 [Prochilodus magdalenae]|nr:hypothetical protein NFI96_026138 [Prochilodus magdalenae]